MRKLLCMMAAVVVLLSGVGSVRAETIDSWTFSISGGFIEWTASSGTGNILASKPITLDGESAWQQLTWGGNGAYSSISVGDTVSGTVLTDGNAVDGLIVTHENNAISLLNKTLVSGRIYLTLELTPDIPGMETPLTFSTTIAFDFYETDNSDLLPDDIFVITNVTESYDSFEYDGYTYSFSYLASFQNLNELYPDYVAEYLDPSATPYYGWVTDENAMTVIPTSLLVVKGKIPDPLTPTPEPGTMLLMGIGLAGIGIVARKRTHR